MTASTYSSIINNTRNISVFLEIWDPWCPHCKKFKEDWYKIKNDTQFFDKVIITDLNCNSEKALCKLFPGSETPRFYWIENSNSKPVRYSQAVTYHEIMNFINKNLYEQINILNPHKIHNVPQEIRRIIQGDPYKQHLIFNVSNNDVSSFSIARNAIKSHKHLPINFLLVNDTSYHYPILYADVNGFPYIFRGSFNEHELSNFIRTKSIPFLSVFTDNTYYYSQINKIDVAVFIFPTSKFENIYGYANYTYKEYITTQTTCSFVPRFCRYIHENPTSPILVIYSKRKNLFYIYRSPFTQKGIQNFLENIRTGKDRGYGPGTGIYGLIFETYYNYRELGGFAFYMMHLPIVCFFFFVICITYAIIDTVRYNIQYKKLEKEGKLD